MVGAVVKVRDCRQLRVFLVLGGVEVILGGVQVVLVLIGLLLVFIAVLTLLIVVIFLLIVFVIIVVVGADLLDLVVFVVVLLVALVDYGGARVDSDGIGYGLVKLRGHRDICGWISLGGEASGIFSSVYEAVGVAGFLTRRSTP